MLLNYHVHTISLCSSLFSTPPVEWNVSGLFLYKYSTKYALRLTRSEHRFHREENVEYIVGTPADHQVCHILGRTWCICIYVNPSIAIVKSWESMCHNCLLWSFAALYPEQYWRCLVKMGRRKTVLKLCNTFSTYCPTSFVLYSMYHSE